MDVRNNHHVDALVSAYRTLRTALEAVRIPDRDQDPSALLPAPPAVAEPKSQQEPPKPRPSRRASRIAAENMGSQAAPIVLDADDDHPPPPPGKVRCPVCGLALSPDMLNTHLDTCLSSGGGAGGKAAGGNAAHSAPPVVLGRKPCGKPPKRLPKLVHSIMKPSQIKAKLREYRLPTHGNRKAMVWRLSEFTLRYNCALDGGEAPTYDAIAARVTNDEQHRKASAKQASSASKAHKSSGSVSTESSPASAGKPRAGGSAKSKSKSKAKSKHKALIKEIRKRKAAKAAKAAAEAAEAAKLAAENPWRVVEDPVSGKPFYYNALANIGTFDPPQELTDPSQETHGYTVLVLPPSGSDPPKLVAIQPAAAPPPPPPPAVKDRSSEGAFFFMREAGDRCFTAEWDADYLVHGNYEIAAETVTPQRIHEFPFSVVIRGPSGAVMFERAQDFSGRFGFTTTEEGTYSVCFNLGKLPRSRKANGRKVSIDISAGLKTDDYTEVAQKEHLSPMEVELRRMTDIARVIKDDLIHMRNREARLRETNESTIAWADTWSNVGFFLVFCLTAWQLYFVRASVKASNKMF
ncbi:uncharacterized protein AMSG_12161 [Thecamonas trahens ATCC 50062]|uniref:Uncharacterized protein n=1 Tax=Thecamonas trahens ATCC 50062 TaxID=461836 RepID=A0A0L0DJ22_THETB|nr:hypothetical protein AMSG_12161 [Thecamonas trahens ATCC 50062]KNC52399.1 hypothetical protein AMSG_12161 [Thecamonas trahens ATCC 50062]|eukprot:XP_013755501.1 hypothetical protein AMSG_12161 [Thecamonas trahens ATCC 50062]